MHHSSMWQALWLFSRSIFDRSSFSMVLWYELPFTCLGRTRVEFMVVAYVCKGVMILFTFLTSAGSRKIHDESFLAILLFISQESKIHGSLTSIYNILQKNYSKSFSILIYVNLFFMFTIECHFENNSILYFTNMMLHTLIPINHQSCIAN